MSVETWTIIFVLITFGLYMYVGWMSRVKETAGFYVAGRGVSALANGAATAADWMSAASFIGMAGSISVLGYDGAVYLMGWTGGYVLLALLLAPYLRKFGRYTVPDFIGDRYYSKYARAVAAVCTVFVSMTYIAGQMRGVGIVFSRYLQVDIVVGVLIGTVIVAFFATIGGMKGVTYTQVAQYGVLMCAYAIPAIAISMKLTGNPIPQLGLTFTDIAQRLSDLQLTLGMNEYIKPFTNLSALNVFAITLSLMVGTAGLPHVIIRFYTVPTVRDARYSAGWALLFIALLYTTAPAIGVFARYNLIDTLANKPLAEVQKISWVDSWGAAGLLKLEDKNGDGIVNMTKPSDPANEVTIDNDMIVLSTPEVAKLAPFIVALVAAGGLAAALSTASGLLIAMSSAVSHDLYYRIFRPDASEQQRMKVGRTMVIVGVCCAAWFGVHPPGFVAEVVAFAFGLAAASIFPVIILGIFDTRTTKEGAIVGMVVGLVFTLSMIVMMQSMRVLGTEAPMLTDFMGINAQGIGMVGMIFNFVLTYVISRLTPPPPAEIQQLVQDVRSPSGVGEAQAH